MPRVPSIVFANLTCRFGNRYALLDLAREVVIPALLDVTMKRRFGSTSYFFIDVGLVDVEVEGTSERQLTIFGRIVKDTVLTRSQIYSADSGLIPDEDSMPSAPSSFFALDLNNHKLAFLPETPHAPPIAAFASTLKAFLRRKHISFVRALYEEAKRAGTPRPLQYFLEQYPHPDLEATPMANKSSISEFLSSFAKLTHLEFRILETNAEFQRQQTFRDLKAMKDELAATTTKLVHDSKVGLNVGAAAEEINASAAAGNQKVVLAGTASDGTELRGSNDSFKLRVSAEDVPDRPAARATHLTREYFKQVEQGRLRPDQSETDTGKIELIRENLSGKFEQG